MRLALSLSLSLDWTLKVLFALPIYDCTAEIDMKTLIDDVLKRSKLLCEPQHRHVYESHEQQSYRYHSVLKIGLFCSQWFYRLNTEYHNWMIEYAVPISEHTCKIYTLDFKL